MASAAGPCWVGAAPGSCLGTPFPTWGPQSRSGRCAQTPELGRAPRLWLWLLDSCSGSARDLLSQPGMPAQTLLLPAPLSRRHSPKRWGRGIPWHPDPLQLLGTSQRALWGAGSSLLPWRNRAGSCTLRLDRGRVKMLGVVPGLRSAGGIGWELGGWDPSPHHAGCTTSPSHAPTPHHSPAGAGDLPSGAASFPAPISPLLCRHVLWTWPYLPKQWRKLTSGGRSPNLGAMFSMG